MRKNVSKHGADGAKLRESTRMALCWSTTHSTIEPSLTFPDAQYKIQSTAHILRLLRVPTSFSACGLRRHIHLTISLQSALCFSPMPMTTQQCVLSTKRRRRCLRLLTSYSVICTTSAPPLVNPVIVT